MDCKYAQKLMMKYMDNEITEKEAKALNEHILQCETCREEFFIYDFMIQEAQSILAEKITAPEGFEQQVMSKVRAEKVPVYGYRKKDKVRAACIAVFLFFFILASVLTKYTDIIISKMLEYHIFEGYVAGVVDISANMTRHMHHIGEIIDSVVSRTDTILSSMAMGILGMIVVACLWQYVLYTKKNKH